MTSVSELNPLIDRLSGIIQSAEPAARKALIKQIATNVRRTQADRIKENKNPDGSQYEARKVSRLAEKKGSIRRKMFRKMARAKWLKARATASEASIEFIGSASRIARVSQYGLRDRVNKRGLEVKYPQRELLGLTSSEIDMIEDIVLSNMMRW